MGEDLTEFMPYKWWGNRRSTTKLAFGKTPSMLMQRRYCAATRYVTVCSDRSAGSTTS
ncbi:hypothetical protein L917_00585 [Phytophthora nicotianae]|uniref:Uncharacterized protein n=1 Tax=Phytophthora nicotianae TaxID=4792 RepID=W2P632_PHYNI|nr:hypothetical protein L917_00585 [Phytophthora nicotianae]ETM56427.1 hypothetical protein L914_00604 [Phytophthora nicotianae]